jgi:hypothetical protein
MNYRYIYLVEGISKAEHIRWYVGAYPDWKAAHEKVGEITDEEVMGRIHTISLFEEKTQDDIQKWIGADNIQKLIEAAEEAYHELRERCGYKPGDHAYDALADALREVIGDQIWLHKKEEKKND